MKMNLLCRMGFTVRFLKINCYIFLGFTSKTRVTFYRMSITYIHCLNTICPSGHDHNDFMATGALTYGKIHLMFGHIQFANRIMYTSL